MTPSKIFIPMGVGIATFVIFSTAFPESFVETNQSNPSNKPSRLFRRLKDKTSIDSIEKLNKWLSTKRIANKIFKQILRKKAFKVALVATFLTLGVQHFETEILQMLTQRELFYLCGKKQPEKLETICKIYRDLKLHQFSESVQESVVSSELRYDQRVEMIKIKLDCLINGPCTGKKRFLVVSLIGLILSLTISGVGGLTIILEALFRLFREGKISKALFKQIITALAANLGVPVETLENLE